ncbi:hypothetical protein PILCRDRAFT_673173 [Piloderma croceum F 1598]|uniref:Uncharacterized protein n=1 Tax=Piloderma croceum (strain F 1598) TaxID=765440 RepID=A0A0C3F660_PILCF|nr:hypothetical protein PILCRDRAFT_673173 [Piloderma croceum F 1598]
MTHHTMSPSWITPLQTLDAQPSDSTGVTTNNQTRRSLAFVNVPAPFYSFFSYIGHEAPDRGGLKLWRWEGVDHDKAHFSRYRGLAIASGGRMTIYPTGASPFRLDTVSSTALSLSHQEAVFQDPRPTLQ